MAGSGSSPRHPAHGDRGLEVVALVLLIHGVGTLLELRALLRGHRRGCADLDRSSAAHRLQRNQPSSRPDERRLEVRAQVAVATHPFGITGF